MIPLAEIDPTLGSEVDVGNWIYILVMTQCDDTPIVSQFL